MFCIRALPRGVINKIKVPRQDFVQFPSEFVQQHTKADLPLLATRKKGNEKKWGGGRKSKTSVWSTHFLCFFEGGGGGLAGVLERVPAWTFCVIVEWVPA